MSLEEIGRAARAAFSGAAEPDEERPYKRFIVCEANKYDYENSFGLSFDTLAEAIAEGNSYVARDPEDNWFTVFDCDERRYVHEGGADE